MLAGQTLDLFHHLQIGSKIPPRKQIEKLSTSFNLSKVVEVDFN
jgi:hypothetical protein